MMDFICKCVEECVPTKTIWVFPNWKPWTSHEMHSQLKPGPLLTSQAILSSTRKLDIIFTKSSRMSRDNTRTNLSPNIIIQIPAECGKVRIPKLATELHQATTLVILRPHLMNIMFSMLPLSRRSTGWWVMTSIQSDSTMPLPMVNVVEVSLAFLRVKATGCILRNCVVHIWEYSWISFISPYCVPTCFRKTTIIPMTKKSKISCLNDHRTADIHPSMLLVAGSGMHPVYQSALTHCSSPTAATGPWLMPSPWCYTHPWNTWIRETPTSDFYS